MGRVRRATWQERVTRWRESGLTAREYAAQIGVNANTLANWHYKLRREAVTPAASLQFVEVTSGGAVAATPATHDPYEVVLTNGRAVRVPSQFDADGLRRLLDVLEGR
jgi:hypothetical protein